MFAKLPIGLELSLIGKLIQGRVVRKGYINRFLNPGPEPLRRL
jgi:hypothetical protein